MFKPCVFRYKQRPRERRSLSIDGRANWIAWPPGSWPHLTPTHPQPLVAFSDGFLLYFTFSGTSEGCSLKEADILEFSVSPQAVVSPVFLKGPGLGRLPGLLFVQALAQMFCPFHTPRPALPRLFPVGLGLYFLHLPLPKYVG